MNRILLVAAAVIAALVAVSCQSALHRSYLRPGEHVGDGLKYYRHYDRQQQTEPTEHVSQSDEQTNITSQTEPGKE